jgi:hypothetical protein
MEPLSFVDAEEFGRNILASGGLEELRQWYSLSYTRLANHLSTNTTALRSWLDQPSTVQRIQATTAARIGQFAYALTIKARELYDQDPSIKVTDLYPLWKLAGELGRSSVSPKFMQLCRSQQLTCIDTVVLGVYVPTIQAEQLKSKVIV